MSECLSFTDPFVRDSWRRAAQKAFAFSCSCCLKRLQLLFRVAVWLRVPKKFSSGDQQLLEIAAPSLPCGADALAPGFCSWPIVGLVLEQGAQNLVEKHLLVLGLAYVMLCQVYLDIFAQVTSHCY
jgi:hypothetical protein